MSSPIHRHLKGAGYTPISYWTYLQDIVNRYKNSPALGMWEPISEPEGIYLPTSV